MTQEQFETLLRQFMRREPFRPFVIETTDGRVLLLDGPRAAFDGGAAAVVTPDEELHFVACDEVREIREANHGVPA